MRVDTDFFEEENSELKLKVAKSQKNTFDFQDSTKKIVVKAQKIQN